MPPSTAIQELNERLARSINDEAQRNPESPYARKYVGIADGQVVAVADDLDSLVQRLLQAGVDPSQSLCVEAGLDYDAVQEIWGLR